jgi:hypothetical protein
LQTRAARAQQEQAAETLRQLSEAMDALRLRQAQVKESEEQGRDEVARPLLKALVDLHDALTLAEREVRRVQETVLPVLEQVASGSVTGLSVVEPEWSEEDEHEETPETEPSGDGEDLSVEKAETTAENSSQDLHSTPIRSRLADPSEARPLPVLPAPPAVSFWARLLGLDRPIRQQQETIAALHSALVEERSRCTAGTPLPVSSAQPLSEDRVAPPVPSPTAEGPIVNPPVPRESIARARDMLASVVTGYTMSVQRVERALRQQGLEPIPAAGQLFDPELMEVLEVVADSGRTSGEVVQEIRRGYLWKGRVFRFAQVRVARSI